MRASPCHSSGLEGRQSESVNTHLPVSVQIGVKDRDRVTAVGSMQNETTCEKEDDGGEAESADIKLIGRRLIESVLNELLSILSPASVDDS